MTTHGLGANVPDAMPQLPTFENQQQLSRDQANVVNNCWSEGSYELGVEALNAFRKGEGRYPSPSHIRHLLVLALYPPEKTTQPLQKNRPPSSPPSKPLAKSRPLAAPAHLSPRKGQVQTEIPTHRGSQLALELLLTLAATTHPAYLTVGLNSYTRPPCDVSDFGSIMSTGKIDTFKSPLAEESVRVGKARDCWAMVRDGFLLPKDGTSTAQAKWMGSDNSDLSDDDKPDSYVASHAWRVVEWWIKLFEVDQVINTVQSATASHSTLLLSHIPPASRPGAPQNDIQNVVGVAFSALVFNPELCEINKLGLRLLTLLVDASATHAISPGTLVRVAADQLPNLSSSAFKTLVTHFTGPVHRQPNAAFCFPVYLYPRFCFCLAACYLSRTGSGVSDVGIFGGITDGSVGRGPKARPTARAPGMTDGQTADVTRKQPLEPYPAPSLDSILALLQSTPRSEGIKSESFSQTVSLYALSRLAIVMSFEKQSAGQIDSPWIPGGDLQNWRTGIATSVRLGFEADARAGATTMADSKRWQETREFCEMLFVRWM
ncbi:unnamed protein product [Rhizoctonia solani]|uniref:Uncharacterized protein n=1 Tax=Rhizoctonia solani AG-3 Rhs1AP TaxID=1086054 RepID=X8IYH0_9AGAM|nr:hypothetical protein RSOL_074490 [Rhizoctonia solani AG-3 Rhs1AP]CAE6520611.1 unnamed protein product [Rhizoctonia solani]